MNQPPFWHRPWSHAHAWVLMMAVLAGAFAVQLLRSELALRLPGSPWNWVVALLPAIAGLVVGMLLTGMPAIRFLGSPALAIASLAALALVSWPLAVFPIGSLDPAWDWLRRCGLGDPLASLPFTLALGVVVVNLAVATGRRLAWRGDWGTEERIRFVILHLGLLTAVIGGTAGHGGLVRERFVLTEGAPPAQVIEHGDGSRLVLPFALRLDDFVLDRFPPMLLLAESDGSLHRGETLIGPDATDRLRGLRIRVREWLPSAAVMPAGPVFFVDPGANPAARVEVGDASGTILGTGWLHPASPVGPELSLALPGGRNLHLEQPRPRRFLARVQVAGGDGIAQAVAIEVNTPLRRDGWAIYILSYDEALGPASHTAVFEAVEDRTLPAVYLGITLLLAGVLWHLWRVGRDGGRTT